ncbi:MAG TPA: hypothetical protein VFJ62_04715, partial [Usitatibacter sp.]|nr:hypothetical protein [Usitatibacter sp.]
MSLVPGSPAAAARDRLVRFHDHDGPEAEQVRMIAELRQKAAALEHELAARRRVEAELAQRERDLADFLENAVVGLHRVGPDGTILWANR